jgi:hypothetical protein
MQPDSSYHLDSNKLNDVIAIVEGETAVLRSLVQIQQQIVPRLKAVAYSFFLSLIVFEMLSIHEWFSYEVFRIVLPAFLVTYVPVCAIVGWKELRATRRLRQTQRSLGLTPDKFIRFVGWSESWQRFVRGSPMVVLFVAGFFIADFGVKQRNPWVVDLGFILFALSLMFFVTFMVRRSLMLFENRLRESERLKASLINQRDTVREAGVTISIPEAEYKEIARIERALVNVERQRAIKASANKKQVQLLPVQQSAAVIEQKASLEPPIRIKVQTCIDELSANPQPENAQAGPDGKWQLEVPETRLHISYAFAEHPRRILVKELSEDLRNTNS